MLKKRTFLAALLLTMLLMCVSAQAASPLNGSSFEDLPFTEMAGYTTEITDNSGNVHTFDGVLQVSALESFPAVERMAGYAICSGEDVLLSVWLHDVEANDVTSYGALSGKALGNGYYSAEVALDKTYSAFLTGLTPDALNELQKETLAAVLKNESVILADMSFIDAEKQYFFDEGELEDDSDWQLCWAGSTSNLLYYTGWAEQAGFYSPDYVFDELTKEFSDDGGRFAYGVKWFFNGYYAAQSWSYWAHDEEGYSSFGGYLPDYCAEQFVTEYDFNEGPESMKTVLTALQEGCGVELGIDWVYNWERTGGHSVSLWGLVYKTNCKFTQRSDVKAIIISDSDNSGSWGDNRRTAPNTLTLYQITPSNDAGHDSWYINTHHGEYDSGIIDEGYIEDFAVLKPYSSAVKADGGTRNTVTTADLAVTNIVTREWNQGLLTSYFPKDNDTDVWFEVENLSHAVVNTGFRYTINVTEQGGETVRTFTGTVGASDFEDDYVKTRFHECGTLDPGVYEVCVSIDCIGQDAYLGNNSLTKTIYVASRSTSADSVKFQVTSNYEGAPNYDGAASSGTRGHESIGSLTFTYSKKPGYTVKQYRLVVKYYSDGDLMDVEELYLGKEPPKEVYGLHPWGDQIAVFLYSLPADPSAGYEMVAYTDLFDIYYEQVVLTSSYQSFSPIYAEASSFASNESLTISLKRYWTKNYPQYFVRVKAESYWGSYEIDSRFITPSMATNGRYTWTIKNFRTETSQGYSPQYLPEGYYTLTLEVYYGNDGDGVYPYLDTFEVGTIEVLPSVSYVSLDDMYVYHTWPPYAYVEATVTTPQNTTFSVEYLFGTSPDALQSLDTVSYTNDDGGTYYAGQSIRVDSNTTYYYQVKLRVGSETLIPSTVQSFTTSAADLTINAACVQEFDMTESDYDSRLIEYKVSPGEHTLCASGKGGFLRLFWGNEEYFAVISPAGCHLDFTALQSGSAYIELEGNIAGIYTVGFDRELTADIPIFGLNDSAPITLKAGECRYYRTPVLPNGGVLSFTCKGKDASIQFWDEGSQMWDDPVYFTGGGKAVEHTVGIGECATFRLTAFVAGDYTAEISTAKNSTVFSETSAICRASATAPGYLIAAAYDENGQMVAIKMQNVSANQDVTLRLNGKNFHTVRLFRLSSSRRPT